MLKGDETLPAPVKVEALVDIFVSLSKQLGFVEENIAPTADQPTEVLMDKE
jgi:hypothetical protein